MRDDEFKEWLKARGANADAARNTRAYAVRTIEAKLSELGSPHPDLEAAWNADRFVQLRERLKSMRVDFAAGGEDFRILMPKSEQPQNRLSSWSSWLAQYGQFLSGEPLGDKDADLIRRYVLENYIEPGREKDEEIVDVLVRDVNEALRLNQAWPNICQALIGKKFLEMADIDPPERIGADQSSATIFRFHLSPLPTEPTSDRPFVLFGADGQSFRPVRNGEAGQSLFHAQSSDGATIKFADWTQIAKAMLLDRCPGRVQPLPRGKVSFLSYAPDQLVRYELDPVIAASIGVPTRGSIDGANTIFSQDKEGLMAAHPTNLILYGPPGTGKTFSTAAEAVRLCGEPVPADRTELMKAYQSLLDAGRIEFVTFHQSIAYEDFVEGLRPTQVVDGNAAGFELRPKHGVFRRIARRAETSTGPGNANFSLEGRKVFKMSIGEAANPEDAYLFEEAIEGGYTLLGFEDIDWSDARFAERDAIIEAVRTEGVMEGGEPNATSGRVQMPFIFRNWVRRGDIIVVSKGNGLFRAIGEVIGDYEFAPREGGDYGHRRAVRWLWIDRAGVPVTEIYARNFMMKSIYVLTGADLNVPALERYIASQQDAGSGAPESFVLIIDEINRANISKVFGELITLLEPDKRIGQPNGLKVRLPYSDDIFGVPSNLHIIGTMNTADRSIALLDTALRRRFEFRELMPDLAVLGTVDGVDLAAVLRGINARIEYLFDREHQIGHAYFYGCRDKAAIDAAMRFKIIPLLAEYFYEDWQKVALVLGDADGRGGFLRREVLKAPPGLDADGEGAERWRWTLADAFSREAYVRLGA